MRDDENEFCEFCKLFDFGRVRTNIENNKYAYIDGSLGYSRFPIEEQFNYCPVCGRSNPNKKLVMKQSKVDAVSVVRCKDCANHTTAYFGKKVDESGVYCIKDAHNHRNDWFCADGERKTE